MWNIKNYKFGFDRHGLLYFGTFILPYLIFACFPNRNEILRLNSKTIVSDYIGLTSNIIMIIILTIVINKNCNIMNKLLLILLLLIPKLLYYACWLCVYFGVINKGVIMIVCLLPCIFFTAFSISRKNVFAIPFSLIYLGTEVAFTVVNVF